MTIDVEAMPDQSFDVRVLTDAEIEAVNGGFIFAALALGALFCAGMALGAAIHKAYYEG